MFTWEYNRISICLVSLGKISRRCCCSFPSSQAHTLSGERRCEIIGPANKRLRVISCKNGALCLGCATME